MRVFPVVTLAVTLCLSGEVAAQSRPIPFPSVEIGAEWQQRPSALGLEGEGRRSIGSRPVLTGFLIGAVVGAVAGYGFYNLICEAVDNQCSDSRVPLIVVGAGVGGALGALVGMAVD